MAWILILCWELHAEYFCKSAKLINIFRQSWIFFLDSVHNYFLWMMEVIIVILANPWTTPLFWQGLRGKKIIGAHSKWMDVSECVSLTKLMCLVHPQICVVQWPRHVRHPSQRSRGHRQAPCGENSSATHPNGSILLPGGAAIPVDHLQFCHLCGYCEFLQPQGSAWAEDGREHDIAVPLGVSERDAQTEDTGFTQQQNHQRSCRGDTLHSQHHLLGSVQQQTGHPACWSHGYLASFQRCSCLC